MAALNGQCRCWPADEASEMMPMPILAVWLDRIAIGISNRQFLTTHNDITETTDKMSFFNIGHVRLVGIGSTDDAGAVLKFSGWREVWRQLPPTTRHFNTTVATQRSNSDSSKLQRPSRPEIANNGAHLTKSSYCEKSIEILAGTQKPEREEPRHAQRTNRQGTQQINILLFPAKDGVYR